MRSLICLTRTPAALEAAHAALQGLGLLAVSESGAPSAASPPALPPGALRSALALAPALRLELLHLPPATLPLAWREGQQLQLVGAHLCPRAAARGGALPALLARAAAARGRVASVLHSLGLASGSHALPLLQLDLPEAAAGGGAQPQPLPPPRPSALKELVLGVPDGAALEAAAAALGGIASRAPGSLSVWRTHCGTLPRLRLLPSAYSALVFHADSLQGVGGGGLPGVELHLHGQRHGFEGAGGSGQLRARGPALAGLDVRFCASAAVAPYFAEDEATLTDVMDPALNDTEGKKNMLACKSIVGMDLVSTLRLRLRGRVG